MTPSTDSDPKRSRGILHSLFSLTQGKFAWLIVAVAVAMILAFSEIWVSDILILANALLRTGLLLVCLTAFLFFFVNRFHKADEKIFSDPLALGVFCGLVAVAIAIVLNDTLAGLEFIPGVGDTVPPGTGLGPTGGGQ